MKNSVWVGVVVAVLLAAAAAAAFVLKPTKPAEPPPNVLIILWDTVRSDRMSIYGHDKPTTPKMAKWANKALVFDNAISPAMWTVPSHGSMFTGTHTTTHGTHVNYKWLDNYNVTMAEWFGTNGYDTYAFSANPNLTKDHYNLVQGFDVVNNSWKGRWKKPSIKNTRRKLIDEDRSNEIAPAWPGEKMGGKQAYAYNAAPVTHKAFKAWLDQREHADKPWFAYLNMMEAHKPRVPSMKARKKIMGDDPELIQLGLQTDLSHFAQFSYIVGKKEFAERELEAIKGVYDASLVDLDNATSAMLRDLKAAGYLDNTIVVLTSDHGEQLGEHQLFAHKTGLYNQVVRVPLIIHYPPKVKPGRVDKPVSNVQLYATLTALAGIGQPEGAQPIVQGNLVDQASEPAEPVYAEITNTSDARFHVVTNVYPDVDPTKYLRTLDTVVTPEHKLIRWCDGQTELYDIANDPQETTDLADSNPDLVAELGQSIDTWKAGLPAYDPTKRVPGDKQKQKISKSQREMLELLGYVEDEDGVAGRDPCAP